MFPPKEEDLHPDPVMFLKEEENLHPDPVMFLKEEEKAVFRTCQVSV